MFESSGRSVPEVEAGAQPPKPTPSDSALSKQWSTGERSNTSPQLGLRILMKDLSYHVPSNKNRRERAYLLKDVNAFLEPGQMTALVRAPS